MTEKTIDLDILKSEATKAIEESKSGKEIKKSIEKLFPKKPSDKITKLREEIERCSSRNFETVIADHKRLIATAGLATGFPLLDEKMSFQKTDLVVVQGASNHGKSSFMLNCCYKILTAKENADKEPMCVYITYESSTIRVEEKLANIITADKAGELFVKRDLHTNNDLVSGESRSGNYLYLDSKKAKPAIALYDELVRDQKLLVTQKQSIEELPDLIDWLQKEYPKRTLVLFLDYIQILPHGIKGEGWQVIKTLAYSLERLAIDKEIIIVTGSQVNDKKDPREGKDIYNAASLVLNIYNHSHDTLKDHSDHKDTFREKTAEGKNIMSLTCRKNKFGETFTLDEKFLFDGTTFERNSYTSGTSVPVADTYKKSFSKRVLNSEAGGVGEF